MQSIIQFSVFLCLCLSGILTSENRDLNPSSQLVDEGQRVFDWSNLGSTSHVGEVKGRRASSFVRIGKRAMPGDDSFKAMTSNGYEFPLDGTIIWQKSFEPFSRQPSHKRRPGVVDPKKLSSFVRLGKRSMLGDQSTELLGRSFGDSDILLLKQ